MRVADTNMGMQSILLAPRPLARLLVWMLVASRDPAAVLQSKAAPTHELQSANIRIDHDVLDEDERMLNIFLDVLRGTGLHGGFVEMGVCSDLPKGHLQRKQGVTARQAMDALVAANPGYRWDLKDGVVNLMPRGGAPLLGSMIVKFQKDATDRDIPVLLGELLFLPTVRERENALGLRPGLGQGSPGVVDEHPIKRQSVPVRVNLHSVYLREAFNTIVRASSKGVWIYHETDCSGVKTFAVEEALDYYSSQ